MHEVKKYKELPIHFKIMVKEVFFHANILATKEDIKDRYWWLLGTTFRTDFVNRLRIF